MIDQVIRSVSSGSQMSVESKQSGANVINRVMAMKKSDMASLSAFFDLILEEFSQLEAAYARITHVGNVGVKLDRAQILPKGENKQDKANKGLKTNPSNNKDCFGCGRVGQQRRECKFMDSNDFEGHPDVNLEKCPWAKSVKGKAWKAKGKDVLPRRDTLSGSPWVKNLKKVSIVSALIAVMRNYSIV